MTFNFPQHAVISSCEILPKLQPHTFKCFLVTWLSFIPGKLKSILLFSFPCLWCLLLAYFISIGGIAINLVSFLFRTFTTFVVKSDSYSKTGLDLPLAPWRWSLSPWHVLLKSVFIYLGAWATQTLRAMGQDSSWALDLWLLNSKGAGD